MNSGGLIEAASPGATPVTVTTLFPPVNSGGLIEASGRRQRTSWPQGRFPPVNSGGLIEAKPFSRHRASMKCFRR